MYGQFARDGEDAVARALLVDLRAEADGTARTLDDYAQAVPDHARQQRAKEVLTAVGGDAPELRRLVEILYFSGQQRLLAKHRLRFPAYNVFEEFFVGAYAPTGPLAPQRPVVDGRSWTFLGKRIGFPLGVPASVLTSNASWVHYFARNGFNVLTYKTVRSRQKDPSPAPNWVYVQDQNEPLPLEPTTRLHADPADWVDVGDPRVTTANSFGVPSYSPEVWTEDLREALHVVHDDQVLIVSVLGDLYDTPADAPGAAQAWADDFARTARLARSCGAEFIELNLSCPNSLADDATVKPPLCLDADLTALIVRTVREAVGPDTKLIGKLSYLPEDRLRPLLSAMAPDLDAVAGINTLQCSLTRADGTDTFPGRRLAGVSGVAVRDHALRFVQDVARIRSQDGHALQIVGMGGVTDPASMQALYEAGAQVVQSASGVFANPFLAQDCVDALGQTLPAVPPLLDEELRRWVKRRIVEAVGAADGLDRLEVVVKVGTPPSQTRLAVDELLRDGELRQVRDRLILAG